MATKRNEVYKCEVCGNIVGVLNGQFGVLVCCGKPMELITENTVDAAVEKHIPVIEIYPDGVKVEVGEVEHPMVEEHYIEWIELIFGNRVCRKHLKPGEKPIAEFCVNPENVTARAYCNLHGLWKGDR